MSDNIVLNEGTGGATTRSLENASGVHHPVSIQGYATTVSDGANVISIPTAAALDDAVANPTTVVHGACLLLFDGTNWDRGRGDSTDGLLVNLGSNNDVVAAGTAAHGAAVSGNPVLIGGENPSGNVSRLQTAPDGDLIVHHHSAAVALTDNASNTQRIMVNESDSGFLALVNFPYYYDGTTWDRVRGDATNGMLVNLGSNNDITGTVTANLGTTDNAVLDTIASPVATISATPLQRVAIFDASDNQITSFGGSGGTSTTDDGAFTAGSGSGTPMMGFATSDSVDSGDVGVVAMTTGRAMHTAVQSVTPGTAASNLGKAEDASHTSGDVGVMALGVRNDDLAALGGTDGDYVPFQMSENGALLICPCANDDYKYAAIDAATSGDNTLVAAVGSRKIRVLAAFMVAAGDVVARFEDGAGGTALTGQMDLTTNSGFTLPFNPAGWFETSANTLLNLELDGNISVDGSLTYILVP